MNIAIVIISSFSSIVVIGGLIVALENLRSIRSARSNLLQRINEFSERELQRKVSIGGYVCTFDDIKKNPGLLELLSWEDLG